MPAAPRRIGLMGGSFDPVHVAHLALARTARDHLGLDEVRWVPVGQAWQKARELAPAADRLAMVQAAIADEPGFVVDDCEIRRDGPSYTLDTVQSLQAQYPGADWFLIIGQDQYRNLPTWQGWDDLLSRVTLAVACRGDDAPSPPEALQSHPHRLVRLPLPPMDVSSTQIRAHLNQGRAPDSLVPHWLNEPVARYIANHQLYASGAPR